MRLIEKRDKEFHQHIVKNRVDPTRQSATNPVPDYYGACENSRNISASSVFLTLLNETRRGENWLAS